MILTADIIVDSLIPLLDHDDTVSFLLTCKQFYSFTSHNSVWKHLCRTSNDLPDGGTDDEYFTTNWRNRYLYRGPTLIYMWTRRDDMNNYDIIGAPPPILPINGNKLLVENKKTKKYDFNLPPEIFKVPSKPTEISTRNIAFPKLLSISTITGSKFLLKEKKPTRIRINPRNIHGDPYYPIFHHFQQRGAELINIPLRSKNRGREDAANGIGNNNNAIAAAARDAAPLLDLPSPPRSRMGSITLSPTTTNDPVTQSLPGLEPFNSNSSSRSLYYTTSSSSNNSASTTATSILPSPSQLFHLEDHHRILKRFKFNHFPETVLLVEDVGLVAVVGPADMAMLSEEIKLPNATSNKSMVLLPATNNIVDCIQIRGVFESRFSPPKRYLVVLDRFGSIYSISTTDIYKVTDIPLYPVTCLEEKIRKTEKIKKYPKILPHQDISFERIQVMEEQSDTFIAYSKQGNVVYNSNGRLSVINQLQYLGVKDIRHTRGYFFALTKTGQIYSWPDGKFDYTQFHQIDLPSGYYVKSIATTPHSFIAMMATTKTPRRLKLKQKQKQPPPKIKPKRRGFFSFMR